MAHFSHLSREKTVQKGYFFSLRYKIIIAFFMVGVGISALLGYTAYEILGEKLFIELKRNIGNVTQLGAEVLDKNAIKALIEKQKEELDESGIEAVESTPEYKSIPPAQLYKERGKRTGQIRLSDNPHRR